MGIYDREYYRGEAAGSSWFWNTAPVCKAIILINIAVFVLQNALHWDEPPFVTFEWLAVSPQFTLRHFRLWQLLTAAFCHADLLHIFFNMLFLWVVGREMEAQYGSRDFLAFYLSAAVVSNLAWVVIRAIAYPDAPQVPVIGASGAVLGVVTLFTLFYPRRELVFFVIPMPMWMILAIDLFFPLLPWLGIPIGSSRIAVEAHLAGAAYAVLYKQLDLRLSRFTAGRPFRPRLRIFSPAAYDPGRPRSSNPSWSSTSVGGMGGKSAPVSVLPEEQLDARLDEVLAKIAREGRAGLTEEELLLLQEASRRARIRRSDRP
ncbi:MAG TPA: rhomboid family intramembrane serine protease [Isosphaeraceae bacterium]|nr:rhomboid family intramembrane serine protease [Isosphaeraceae bacterium]